MIAEPKWYAFYTKSRHEKKVKELLQRRGFDVFLPMQKVVRQWSDRKKKVEAPLFNSYIFVFVPEHQTTEVLQIPGIAWSVRHNGKPAFLHEREYKAILRFLETGLTIEIVAGSDVEEGDQVQVLDGPLKGATGFVARKQPDRFMVLLEGIGQAMRVEIMPELLKKM